MMHYLAHILLILFLLSLSIEAKTFTFNQIHRMPQSVEKDYYIWRFLSQGSTTSAQAKAIIKDVNHLNKKLRTSYRRKTGTAPKVYRKAKARKPATQAQKQAWRYKSAKLKSVIKSKTPFNEWSAEEPYVQCYVFNNCGKIKRKSLNRPISKLQYRKMTTDKSFNKSVHLIMSEGLGNLKQALYYKPAAGNEMTFNTHFKIAMDALRHGNKKVAVLYFDQARKKAQKREEADKATFWLYLTTGKKGYLRNLLKSWDVNLYTLIARDMMHIKYPKTMTPKLPRKNLSHYNEQDPIQWAYIKKKLFKPGANLNSLAKGYKAEESVGVYTYIKAKESHQKNIYYPIPYRNIMSQLPRERQALIYAIARQESRFVPASVSRSFALGMMQIMPFLVKHIAKQRGESIDLDEMFNPRKAIVYANHHLNYLTTYLYNPLFIAYAYNGGIGFTKRLIQRPDYFRKGLYEPYLSMEKMTNIEAREYGKRVLVNYIIYLNKLGVSARILPYLQALSNPSKTDSFRK